MANCYAGCKGTDGTGRTKGAHRLGSKSATGLAQTFRTFAEVTVRKDGSGTISVRRGDKTYKLTINPESEGLEVAFVD
jgi:hypothetical protein